MQHHEDAHQAALFDWVERVRAKLPELRHLFAIPNGGFRNKVTAARLKKQGVRAGVPDVQLPVARGGFFGLFVEMKRPAVGKQRAGVTSSAQRDWIRDLREQGYRVEIAFGWEQAAEILEKYLSWPKTVPVSSSA